MRITLQHGGIFFPAFLPSMEGLQCGLRPRGQGWALLSGRSNSRKSRGSMFVLV